MWQPFGASPNDNTAHWKSSPNERGTLSILSTCVLTLILCAYTSLHLNIPQHGKSSRTKKFWKLTWWVFLGLEAPEVVAFIALQQWLYARNLEQQMKTIFGDLLPGSEKHRNLKVQDTANNDDGSPASTGSSKRRNQWTRTHSHFAIMGGFAFDTSTSPIRFFHRNHTQIMLTPHALRILAKNEPDIIPDIPVSAIQDKSKSNGFAKFLVCLQACWFIAQTVGRLATSSPISLLEFNTLLHAVYCLIVYLAWWDKPHDISEPILIETSTDHLRQVCAWMIMNSQLGIKTSMLENEVMLRDRVLYTLSNHRGTSWGHLLYDEDMRQNNVNTNDKELQQLLNEISTNNRRHNRIEDVSPCDGIPAQFWDMDPENILVKLYPGQRIYGFTVLSLNKTHYGKQLDPYTYLPPEKVDCLRLARSLRTECSTGGTWVFDWNTEKPDRQGMLRTHIPVASSLDDVLANFRGSNWFTRMFRDAVAYVYGISLLLAGSLYGLIHLFAWNGPFPTQSERWMWRISCLIIASPLFMSMVLGILFFVVGVVILSTPLHRFWEKSWKGGIRERVTTSIAIFTLLVYAPVYIAARVFILVECFLNLAHLPAEVYLEPEWSKYIPHFGSG